MIPDIPHAAESVLGKLFHPSFLHKPYTQVGSTSYAYFKKLFPTDDFIYTGDELKEQEDHRLIYARLIARVWPLMLIFSLAGTTFYLVSQIYISSRRKGIPVKEKVIISAVAIVLTGVICRVVLLIVLTVTSWDAPYGYIAPAYGLVSMLFVILFARLLDFCCGLSRPLANSGR